ncbi:class I SAM-dependent methyltransferase [Terrimonas ferruginea]|uniref:class I SAM-dependent methyltransferase n=1 Tax=Terrimonas ferruginea TaxID=249 RepID=UPI0003FD6637|nr:class I SAM-dependent methyltransferase [Terrimonas ferruginea]
MEFWESAFRDKQEMWGPEPAQAAIIAKEYFIENGVKNVLIPGIGYGRNAQLFLEAGMQVTGIEISATAIALAKKHYGEKISIHHGSVTGMPFDDQKYDGIFCYALIHLLDTEERKKLVRDCFNQLEEGGYMVFTAITKEAATYGQGKLIGKDRYEQFGGVRVFFYDDESIQDEFKEAGLIEVSKITENFPFYLVKGKKQPG